MSAKGTAGRLQGDNANCDGGGNVAPRRRYEGGRSKRLDDQIYLLTAIRLTPGGSSTVHIYTNNTQNNTMKTEYTEQKIHNNKNT